jgi:hypothetical protein
MPPKRRLMPYSSQIHLRGFLVSFYIDLSLVETVLLRPSTYHVWLHREYLYCDACFLLPQTRLTVRSKIASGSFQHFLLLLHLYDCKASDPSNLVCGQTFEHLLLPTSRSSLFSPVVKFFDTERSFLHAVLAIFLEAIN